MSATEMEAAAAWKWRRCARASGRWGRVGGGTRGGAVAAGLLDAAAAAASGRGGTAATGQLDVADSAALCRRSKRLSCMRWRRGGGRGGVWIAIAAALSGLDWFTA